MLNQKKIAVVVPSYNEESQIGMVIDNMPTFVDYIIVVNDCSTDNTEKIVTTYIGKNKIIKKNIIYNIEKEPTGNNDFNPIYNEANEIQRQIRINEDQYFTKSKTININKRLILINHDNNAGVGAAIASGYKWCRDNNIDCTAVMAGDGQMDPSELESICMPVITEGVDYVKGNRLIHPSAFHVVPKIRFLGNSILSLLTKVASGYWRVSDTQTGYTAISLKALNKIKIHKIYPSYGMPNDILVKLNIAWCTLREVEIKPVYRVGEQSKMKIGKVIPKISLLLFKLFVARLWGKYLFRSFHPLFLLYNVGFVLMVIDIPIIYILIKDLMLGKNITYQSLLIFIFLSISSFQSFMFAMWMDIQDNERLNR